MASIVGTPNLIPPIMGLLHKTPCSEPHLRSVGVEVHHLGTLHVSYPLPGDNGVFQPQEIWCPTSLKIIEREGVGSILSGGKLSSKDPEALLRHLNDPFLDCPQHHRGRIKDTLHNLQRDELV